MIMQDTKVFNWIQPLVIAVYLIIISISFTGIEAFAAETEGLARIGDVWFDSVEKALESSTSGDTVYVEKDCTITRDVIVPAGVTLFIPCQENDPSFVSGENVYNPAGSGTLGQPKLYRKLTINSGVTMTVRGTLIVNAVTGYEVSSGKDHDVSGGYAQIDLNGRILIESGGLLDVYGYVKGTGNIHAKNGARVYDLYVVRHWRGGLHALLMYGSSVYPINEYDCHNITVSLRVDYGASYEGTVRMYASDDGTAKFFNTRFPQVNNSNGLIRLTDASGYMIKTYAQGREVYSIYGGAKFSSCSMNLANETLNTNTCVYPIDGDITFSLNHGNYIFNESFKFLPGAELNIGGNTSVTVEKDKYLVLYQEFDDVDNLNDTEYPKGRNPVIMNMADGSSLVINGRFAGSIKAGDAMIQKGENARITNVKTLEANGYQSSRVRVITHDFSVEREGYTYQWSNNNIIWRKTGDTSHNSVENDSNGKEQNSNINNQTQKDEIIISNKVKSLKSNFRTTTSIKLQWRQGNMKPKGYRVQLLVSGKVKKTKYTTKCTYTFKDLSAAKTYKFIVTPYTVKNSKKVYGEKTQLTAVTSPKKVTMKKVTSLGKKAIRVTWKKTSCSGYQIMIATNKKFSKGVKKYIVSSKVTSKKITGLKKGKKYYVRIRAYKKCNGTTYHGKWNKYKTIKCK